MFNNRLSKFLFGVLIVYLVILFTSLSRVNAFDVGACKISGDPIIFVVTFPEGYSDDYPPFIGTLINGSIYLTADEEGYARYWDGNTELHLHAESQPECSISPEVVNGYKPSAVGVDVMMDSDCAFIYIDNLDGGESLVADVHGEPILLHYGEQLFVSPYGVDDPDRYRAEATACY